MSSPRWIRPVPGATTASAAAPDLNLEDLQALARQMVCEAREKVRDSRNALAEMEREIARRRAAAEEELRQRGVALEKEFEELRRQRRAEVDEERARVLEAAREEGRQEGRREGFEQGYGEGREKGYREGHADEVERLRSEAAAVGATLEGVVTELRASRGELVQAARSGLLHVAIEIARVVIRRELRECHREVVVQSLDRALDLIFQNDRITVLVHPDDVPAIESYVGDTLDRLRGNDAIEVRSCRDLQPGDCRVLAGTGVVDLAVQTQLEVIERSLGCGGGVDHRRGDGDASGAAAGGSTETSRETANPVEEKTP